MIIGYTQGTFDTLHYGHINLLEKAKAKCDFLVVGVNSDALVKTYKNTETFIKEKERIKIISSIKYVDKVILCETLDKVRILSECKFDIIFIGDDWKNSQRWIETEKQLKEFNIAVMYIPYTKGISSTIIKRKLNKTD